MSETFTTTPIPPNTYLEFHLDRAELESLNAWRTEHDKTCRYAVKSGAIGGRLTYTFTPTSLAVIKKVECACGAEHDMTDYEGW